MATKQQFSFFFAFLTMAIILQLVGEATAQRGPQIIEDDPKANQKALDDELKAEGTSRAEQESKVKEFQTALEKKIHEQEDMPEACDKSMNELLETTNKYMAILKGGDLSEKSLADLKAGLGESFKHYAECKGKSNDLPFSAELPEGNKISLDDLLKAKGTSRAEQESEVKDVHMVLEKLIEENENLPEGCAKSIKAYLEATNKYMAMLKEGNISKESLADLQASMNEYEKHVDSCDAKSKK